MSYTYYKLQKDAPAIKIIKSFEENRDKQIDALNAEIKKWGATGAVRSGRDGSIIALQFPTDKQPEGWKIPNDLKYEYTHDEDTKQRLNYYRLMGSSKVSKVLREHWSSLKVDNFRQFTAMFNDLPKGVSGWGFQEGLTIRQMGYEKLGKNYILIVPINGAKNSKQYVPEKATELLNSEYRKMGGKN